MSSTSIRSTTFRLALAAASLFAAGTHAEDLPTIPVDQLPATEQPAAKTEEPARQLEKVEVTGSRIKRAQSETSQPVTVLTRKDIDRTGLTTVGDLINSLPDAGSALGQRNNNNAGTSAGAVNIDLHNLGSQRVLVLVNGHRWVNGLDTLASSAVDLSTIPLAVIDRIEVLKDGASAIYGSDAIAGVVNIITTKKFDIAQFQTQAGGFSKGDGLTQNSTLSFGRTVENTSVFLNASYQQQKPVFAKNRAISAVQLFGTGLTRGSAITPQGHYLFIPDESTYSSVNNGGPTVGHQLIADPVKCPDLTPGVAFGTAKVDPPIVFPPTPGALQLCNIQTNNGASGLAAGDYHAFDVNTDPYNYALTNYLKTPFNQSAIFGQIQQNFGEGQSFNLQLLYNRRQSTLQNAETPLLLGDAVGIPPYKDVFLDPMAKFNPIGYVIGRAQGTGTPAGSTGLNGTGAVLRRLTELGPRIFNQTVNTYFASGQFSGAFELGLPVTYEAGYSYGTSKYSNVNQGLVNMQRVGLALGPAANCVAPCVPLNLFGGPGSITQAMLDYIKYNGADSVTSSATDLYTNFSLEAGTLGFLPKPLGIAFGLEKRHSSLDFTPDALAAAGISSTNSTSATAGATNSKEAFVELEIPLLRKLPGIDSVDISTAVRYGDFGSSGKTTTGKLGLSYRPIQQLMLRGTYSQAFRAPDVGDQFLGRSTSFSVIVDPCTGANYKNNPNATANCDNDGVDQNSVSAGQAQIPDIFGGNPTLKPETATSIDLGVVFSPDALEGFDTTFDYYDIKLKNLITVPGGQFLLDTCYNTPRNGGAAPPACSAVSRGMPTTPNRTKGAVLSVLDLKQNFAGLNTSGFDFIVGYRLPLPTDFGKFKFSFDSNYLLKYDQITPLGGGATNTDRLAGTAPQGADTPLPRFKANSSLAWGKGAFSAVFSARYVHSLTEACEDGRKPSLVSLGLCTDPTHKDKDGVLAPRNRLRSAIYNDVQIGYKFKPQKAEFTFGINNVFDQSPPVARTAAASNSFTSTLYEIPGIQPYLRVKKDF